MPLANKKTTAKMTPIKNPVLLNDLAGASGGVIRTPIPKMTPLKSPVSFAGASGGVIRPTRKIPLMTPLKSPVSFAGASGGVIRSKAPPRQNVKKYKK